MSAFNTHGRAQVLFPQITPPNPDQARSRTAKSPEEIYR